MQEDKYTKYHKEAFDYEMPRDEITPGFIMGVVLAIFTMVGLLILFSMLIAFGILVIGAK